MFEYNITTWLLLFFIYAFLGWVWESSYVSIKSHKWTNRGFLYGTFLPIYGFGAIIVLFSTLPVVDSKIGIFIVGSLSATILELVSGYFLEKIFKVRYWDYSYLKYQYKGYICLSSSIGWGFFSILLVDYLNVPIENFLSQFPEKTLNIAAIVILIPFSIDVIKSVHDALDVRKLLDTIEENNKTVAKLAEYVDTMHVRLGKDTNELKTYVSNLKNKILTEEDYAEIVNDIREETSDSIENISSDIENAISEEEKASKEKIKVEYEALNSKLDSDEFSLKHINSKVLKSARSLLRRNPTKKNKSYEEDVEKLDK